MVTLVTKISRPVAVELCDLMAMAHPNMQFRVSGWDGVSSTAGFSHRLHVACGVEFTPKDDENGEQQRIALRKIALMLLPTLELQATKELRASAAAMGFDLAPRDASAVIFI